MGKKDPKVDAYIARRADFARPILHHIRRLVHIACPDVEEAIKGAFPHFVFHGNLCAMAGFKEHCSFGFWHRAMQNVFGGATPAEGMGQLGKIASLADLPSDADMIAAIKKAALLNASGTKSPRRNKTVPKPPPKCPPDFRAGLAKNKMAAAAFARSVPSHQREYIQWIAEAKREETRKKRIDTAIQWLAEGKSRNWKYER